MGPVTSPAGKLDVDARFLLANERTLLAWVRTSLTLLAVGVGLQQFGSSLPARQLLAGVVVALGGLAAVAGLVRYRRADGALRRGELPTVATSGVVLMGTVALVALGCLIAVLLDARV
jgi:putative membrane protein